MSSLLVAKRATSKVDGKVKEIVSLWDTTIVAKRATSKVDGKSEVELAKRKADTKLPRGRLLRLMGRPKTRVEADRFGSCQEGDF